MLTPTSILVILENNSRISPYISSAQKEAIAVACDLAPKKVMLAIFGDSEQSVIDECSDFPVETIWVLKNTLLDDYSADGYCIACSQLIEHCQPDLVLFSHSYRTRDFAPKLAAQLKKSLICDCVSYMLQNNQLVFQRPLFQGRLQADFSIAQPAPALVTLQAGCFSSTMNQSPTKQPVIETQLNDFPVTLQAEQIRTLSGSAFYQADHRVDLSKSNVIIAIGRGIKSAEHLPMFEKLARLTGAELAASRPVCDEGWLAHERQIGSSGQSVSPDIYLALGISGAIQHIVGMRTAKTIVAINQDKNAPIFQIADIGIVGDLFEIVPAMIKRLEE